jgi:hypothetical protein
MEHRHRCLYCDAAWSCGDDCPYAGPSACERCRERLRRTPGAPRRVIPLRAGSPVLDGLTEHTAERLRRRLRGDRLRD